LSQQFRTHLVAAELFVNRMIAALLNDNDHIESIQSLVGIRRSIHYTLSFNAMPLPTKSELDAHMELNEQDGALYRLWRAKEVADELGLQARPLELAIAAMDSIELAIRTLRRWRPEQRESIFEHSVRRVFLDTEFMECDGHVELISVGGVMTQSDNEPPRLFYAENCHADLGRANEWVKANVIPNLSGTSGNQWDLHNAEGGYLPPSAIGRALEKWVTQDCEGRRIELWGWYAAFDFVAISSLYGRMVDIPKGMPRRMRDVKQLHDRVPLTVLPPPPTQRHHALSDAEWTRQAFGVTCEAIRLNNRTGEPAC
jgi:hypothetical protein